MFQVGQLVECVDDVNWPSAWRALTATVPVKGRVYTVREVATHENVYGLCLEEIIDPIRRFSDGFTEPKFNQARFRPIREQSIEIFREIARGVREPERE